MRLVGAVGARMNGRAVEGNQGSHGYEPSAFTTELSPYLSSYSTEFGVLMVQYLSSD